MRRNAAIAVPQCGLNKTGLGTIMLNKEQDARLPATFFGQFAYLIGNKSLI
jgi:hypothetical protein